MSAVPGSTKVKLQLPIGDRELYTIGAETRVSRN
jgi:hypothetical protein